MLHTAEMGQDMKELIQRRQKKSSGHQFNLRLYLGVTTGIAVAVLGIVLWLTTSTIIRHNALETAELNAQAVTQAMLTRMQTRATRPPTDAGDGAISSSQAMYLGNFANVLKEFQIENIRIYDERGCILYSFPEEQIGACVEGNQQLQEALNGQTVSRVQRNGANLRADESDQTAQPFPVDAIMVYVPVEASGLGTGVPIPRVFEIYLSIAPLQSALQQSLRTIAGVLLVTMGIFFGVQLYFGHRAERIIHKQHQTLEQRNREMEELQQVKDDLTYMIVHDMKNPLGGIMGYLSMMLHYWERDEIKPAHKEFLERAYAGSQHLLDMTMNLLDITRMEEGKLELDHEPIDLPAMVEEVTQTFAPTVAYDDKHIEIEVTPDLPTLHADHDILRRILTNLVSNAIKHTDRDGHIAIRATRQNGHAIQISVRDDGEGVPKSAIPNLFQKFSQVENKRLGYRTDTGLGLAFCKLAVETHGGQIAVESEIDQGTQFTFTLPVADGLA